MVHVHISTFTTVLSNVTNIAGCYGINDEDSDSGKSNDTDSPTELWFCDACKIGVQPVSLLTQTWITAFDFTVEIC